MIHDWQYIMLHHSASFDSDLLNAIEYERYHRSRGWRDIGYHWIVEKIDGVYVALMGRPMYMTGSHCKGMNNLAIGVCLAGNFDEAPVPDAQFQEAVELVSGLIEVTEIPIYNIVAHNDYSNTNCPGDKLDLGGFRLAVIEKLKAS